MVPPAAALNELHLHFDLRRVLELGGSKTARRPLVPSVNWLLGAPLLGRGNGGNGDS